MRKDIFPLGLRFAPPAGKNPGRAARPGSLSRRRRGPELEAHGAPRRGADRHHAAGIELSALPGFKNVSDPVDEACSDGDPRSGRPGTTYCRIDPQEKLAACKILSHPACSLPAATSRQEAFTSSRIPKATGEDLTEPIPDAVHAFWLEINSVRKSRIRLLMVWLKPNPLLAVSYFFSGTCAARCSARRFATSGCFVMTLCFCAGSVARS